MIDLKSIRKANKMSQIIAARYFGCDQSFISQIESNSRPIPDAFISKILADTNIVIPKDISEEINKKLTGISEGQVCKLCVEKDRSIKLLEESNNLLKDMVAILKERITILENDSKGENIPAKQTG